jgi:hypothetical protein
MNLRIRIASVSLLATFVALSAAQEAPAVEKLHRLAALGTYQKDNAIQHGGKGKDGCGCNSCQNTPVLDALTDLTVRAKCGLANSIESLQCNVQNSLSTLHCRVAGSMDALRCNVAMHMQRLRESCDCGKGKGGGKGVYSEPAYGPAYGPADQELQAPPTPVVDTSIY